MTKYGELYWHKVEIRTDRRGSRMPRCRYFHLQSAFCYLVDVCGLGKACWRDQIRSKQRRVKGVKVINSQLWVTEHKLVTLKVKILVVPFTCCTYLYKWSIGLEQPWPLSQWQHRCHREVLGTPDILDCVTPIVPRLLHSISCSFVHLLGTDQAIRTVLKVKQVCESWSTYLKRRSKNATPVIIRSGIQRLLWEHL